MARISRTICLLATAMALTAGAAGCSSGGGRDPGGSGGATAAAGGGTYTAADIAKATGAHKVRPLFTVPKRLPKKYRVVFLNNGESNPYFATWHQAMTDAAKFYGVDFQDIDLNFKYEDELADYKQVTTAQAPDVVGANIMNDAVYHQIQTDGAKLVMVDGTYKNVPHFGVPDAKVGRLAIKTLAPYAKKNRSGTWKGKTLDVVGMSAPNCAPCDARVKAGFKQAESDLGIPASRTFMLTPQGQDPTTASQSTFSDFLTAHPHDAVLVMSYGDEPPLGAVNAAKAAGRTADVLAVCNGGDPAARAALRQSSNKGILVGAIDYQPYAEGWNFIEAAIATAMGKSIAPFRVDRVLTPANVDTYYPDDK